MSAQTVLASYTRTVNSVNSPTTTFGDFIVYPSKPLKAGDKYFLEVTLLSGSITNCSNSALVLDIVGTDGTDNVVWSKRCSNEISFYDIKVGQTVRRALTVSSNIIEQNGNRFRFWTAHNGDSPSYNNAELRIRVLEGSFNLKISSLVTSDGGGFSQSDSLSLTCSYAEDSTSNSIFKNGTNLSVSAYAGREVGVSAGDDKSGQYIFYGWFDKEVDYRNWGQPISKDSYYLFTMQPEDTKIYAVYVLAESYYDYEILTCYIDMPDTTIREGEKGGMFSVNGGYNTTSVHVFGFGNGVIEEYTLNISSNTGYYCYGAYEEVDLTNLDENKEADYIRYISLSIEAGNVKKIYILFVNSFIVSIKYNSAQTSSEIPFLNLVAVTENTYGEGSLNLGETLICYSFTENPEFLVSSSFEDVYLSTSSEISVDSNFSELYVSCNINLNASAPIYYSVFNIFLAERYEITFNSNDGQKQQISSYKPHGVDIIMPSSATFSRDGYFISSWNESSDGNGNFYLPNNTFSKNCNMNLYAIWEGLVYEVTLNVQLENINKKIYLKYSSGFFSDADALNKIDSILTVISLPNIQGYNFNGFYTSKDGQGEQIVDKFGNLTKNTTFTFQNTTLYAYLLPNVPAYWDSEGGYWYIEYGKMPQSKVTDPEILNALNNNIGVSVSENGYYFASAYLLAKIYEGEEYCNYFGNWYKVEPIRWRLDTTLTLSASGYQTTDAIAVMENVVYAGKYSNSSVSLNDGYISAIEDSSFINNFLLNFNSHEKNYILNFSNTSDKFSSAGIVTENSTSNIFLSSEKEISSVCKGTEASFSDLATDYLEIIGSGEYYFTRDLGTNLNSIKTFTANGGVLNKKPTDILGMRFTIKVTEFVCIG